VCKSLAELFCAIEPYVLAPRFVINFRRYNTCRRGLMTDNDFMGPLLSLVPLEYELGPISPATDPKVGIERSGRG
jgi:hypothetical protein